MCHITMMFAIHHGFESYIYIYIVFERYPRVPVVCQADKFGMSGHISSNRRLRLLDPALIGGNTAHWM